MLRTLLATWLLWSFGSTASTIADQPTGDHQMSRTIADRLRLLKQSGKLDAVDLTVEVDDGVVRVSGQVSGATQSLSILKVIADIQGIEDIQLTLGIGKPPIARCVGQADWPVASCDPDWWKRSLQWDDGQWDLNFDYPTMSRWNTMPDSIEVKQ